MSVRWPLFGRLFSPKQTHVTIPSSMRSGKKLNSSKTVGKFIGNIHFQINFFQSVHSHPKYRAGLKLKCPCMVCCEEEEEKPKEKSAPAPAADAASTHTADGKA